MIMTDTPFSIAAHKAVKDGNCEMAGRMAVEGRIALRLVEAALNDGFRISVNDGEETVVSDSEDKQTIMEAMFSTDEDILHIHNKGSRVGWIQFIYGNSGWDVISDYSDNDKTRELVELAQDDDVLAAIFAKMARGE
jgi:hypothetical protein